MPLKFRPLSKDRFNNVKGPATLFSTAGFFSFFDTMLKYLSHRLPIGEIVLARFLLGLIISGPSLVRNIKRLDFISFVLLVARGLLGAAAIFSLVNAFRLGTLSGSMVLFFTNPIWTLVLSAVLLKERLTGKKVIGVMAAFSGAVLVIDPWRGGIAVGDLLGLAAGIFAGASMVVVRHLRARFGPLVIYGFHSLVGIIVAIPFVAHEAYLPDAESLILLTAVSFVGLMGQISMTYGLRYVRAAEAAVILMTELVLVVIIGVIFFNETMSSHFLLGAAMILSSGVLLARARK